MNDMNPHLSPKSKYLNREMTAWEYDAIKQLFEGTEDFALYAEDAAHEMVFFWTNDRFWLFSRAPKVSWDDAAPEIVIDWIGASAEKEHGAEPVLMHRDELPTTARGQVEYVRETDPEHVYDELS
jgi:hypothetical protein